MQCFLPTLSFTQSHTYASGAMWGSVPNPKTIQHLEYKSGTILWIFRFGRWLLNLLSYRLLYLLWLWAFSSKIAVGRYTIPTAEDSGSVTWCHSTVFLSIGEIKTFSLEGQRHAWVNKSPTNAAYYSFNLFQLLLAAVCQISIFTDNPE